MNGDLFHYLHAFFFAVAALAMNAMAISYRRRERRTEHRMFFLSAAMFMLAAWVNLLSGILR